jgi:hypothetical protein
LAIGIGATNAQTTVRQTNVSITANGGSSASSSGGSTSGIYVNSVSMSPGGAGGAPGSGAGALGATGSIGRNISDLGINIGNGGGGAGTKHNFGNVWARAGVSLDNSSTGNPGRGSGAIQSGFGENSNNNPATNGKTNAGGGGGGGLNVANGTGGSGVVYFYL